MDTYRIPLVWQMYGHCDVDADSQEDAIEIALGPDTPLPDGFYVEDPVAVDYEVLELDQDKKSNVLTKKELKLQLQQGHRPSVKSCVSEIRQSQEGMRWKIHSRSAG